MTAGVNVWKDSREACVRCGTKQNLEVDHVVERWRGGTDDRDNLRTLCRGCHDYRHTRDSILREIRRIEMWTAPYRRPENSRKLSLLMYRLGVLEALNTPDLVRERGYTTYWTFESTHYEFWAPVFKKLNHKRGVLAKLTMQLTDA